MAFISDESILEVKRAADIAEVVQKYIPSLKKAGANFKALCPFHEEKTPSFNVHPEKGIFKCFGCGKAGDAIDFVREMDKVEYPEAIRILAEMSGITLAYQETGGPAGPRKEDLYRVNEWAAGVFRKLLAADEAAHARAYLQKRAVTAETEETFRLGYAPNEWEGLLSRARKAGYSDDLMIAAGLAIKRDNAPGCYDRFRNRVMFPITDSRGKTVAFGARSLGEDEGAKYINTSETALFSKGRNFYALDLQRDAIEKSRTVYIVEGYFDVILPYQHDVRGLVATLGTALTKDHLKVLRRYVDKVVLVFDGDAAGQKANERGLDMLLAENMDLYVAALPADEDPCDVVVNRGADRLRAALEKPQEIFEFLVKSLQAKHGSGTPAAQARIINEVLDRLRQIPDPVKVEVLLRQVALTFKLDERTLRAKLAGGTPAKIDDKPEEEDDDKPSAEESAGHNLLGLLLACPGVAPLVRQSVPIDKFPGRMARDVASKAYASPALSGGDLLALLESPAQRQLVASLLAQTIDERAGQSILERCLDYLRDREVSSVVPQLKEAIRGATNEEQTRLLQEAIRQRDKQPIRTRSLPGHGSR